MVLFILFNDIGMSVEQWKKHPRDSSKKTSFLTKLKKFGEIFVYNPVFYNFNEFNSEIINKKYSDNFKFTIKCMNLQEHCKKLFTQVYPIDSEFILISHSLGYLVTHVFAEMFPDNVKGIININGGCTKDKIKTWLSQEKIQHIKKIKDRELNQLFANLESKKLVNESISLLDQIVKYNILKQFNSIPNELKCPIYIFTNIKPKNELEVLDKFNFVNEMSSLNDNIKAYFFLDKSDFLYFDIDKKICECVAKLTDEIKIEQFD